MHALLAYLLIGTVDGSIYAISASGLVLTYVTSGVFNLAHGAIGMFLAFLFWELRVAVGVPVPIALLVTLLVAAPIIGILLDTAVMRRLLGVSLATQLVVTVALLVLFQGLATAIWGIQPRSLPPLWGSRTFKVSGLVVNWDQATIVLAALAVALGLWALLRLTRLGVAMRAVVDNPELCMVKGLNPSLVTKAAWSLGVMLAGLAAILIAPGLNLDPGPLSLLVVAAYAAAIWGRLRSLPATFAGALILGITQDLVVGYLGRSGNLATYLQPAIPFVLLFVALLVCPPARLAERNRTPPEPAPPRASRAFVFSAGGVLLLLVAAVTIPGYELVIGSKGFAYSVLLMSLMLLTGLSGQVSLMQFSFAGIGAVVFASLPHSVPYLVGMLVAAGVAAGVGMLVALPAARLRGIYLALATLAFAILADGLFFGNDRVLGGGRTLALRRPSLGGVSFTSEPRMFVLAGLATLIVANVLLALRRRSFGRKLAALRDSPTASETQGMNLAKVRFEVFGISAAIAGMAGVMLGSVQTRVSAGNFLYLNSLLLLLVAASFGITRVSGALLGALFFAVLPTTFSPWIYHLFHAVLPGVFTSNGGAVGGLWIQPLLIGFVAFALSRHPEGMIGQILDRLRAAWPNRSPVAVPAESAQRETQPYLAVPPSPTVKVLA